MPPAAGQILELLGEKPVFGGDVLARADGFVILVAGAIPGERVRARVTSLEKGYARARVEEILEPSPDRRASPCPQFEGCAGCVYLHVAYPRQAALKAEVVRDALARLARVAWPDPIEVTSGPEFAYRIRARVQVARSGDRVRLGFFRQGSRHVCPLDACPQLSARATDALKDLEGRLGKLPGAVQILDVEVNETVDGRELALNLRLRPGSRPAGFGALGDRSPADTLTYSFGDSEHADVVRGRATLDDRIGSLALRRHVRAFFQGNRYLLEPLVAAALEADPGGPALDLYCGVGLFGLELARRQPDRTVVGVEGSRPAASNAQANARLNRLANAHFLHADVERFLERAGGSAARLVVVDPPRTGLSAPVAAWLVAHPPLCLVYVSCDPATLARDLRKLLAGGYRIDRVRALDLFPDTAHIETVVTLSGPAA